MRKSLSASVLRMAAFVVVVAAAACSGVTPEEAASLAAKGYYTHLARGQYDAFLDGRVGADSLPADYREQLLMACKQFTVSLEKIHRGISDVSVANAQSDSLGGGVNVFLVLTFADSVSEEIVVPMVERGGSWRMR